MSTPKNTPHERGEMAKEIAAGRLAAGRNLFYLFGGTDAEGTVYDGVLHQYPMSALLADPKWKDYLDGVRKDPHAKTLAIVSASRNDPKFPATLVAELFSNEEKDQDSGWFAGVFLAGAAEIHKATGKGLILPINQSSLDLVRSAFNLVRHLSEEERKRLGLFLPEEAPQRQLATSLAGILQEAEKCVDEPGGLTAAQRFYRWAISRWEDREDRRKKEAAENRRHLDSGKGKENGEDHAGIFPAPGGKPPAPAAVAASPVPTPPTATITETPISPPEPPKKRRGGAESAPPPPATAVPAAQPAAPATSSLLNGKDEEQNLVLEALAASGPAGKAMAALVRRGQRTLDQAMAFAAEKGLL